MRVSITHLLDPKTSHWHYLRILYMNMWYVRAEQLDSVAQLVGGLHWNRRATGSNPVRGPIVALFTTAPS